MFEGWIGKGRRKKGRDAGRERERGRSGEGAGEGRKEGREGAMITTSVLYYPRAEE